MSNRLSTIVTLAVVCLLGAHRPAAAATMWSFDTIPGDGHLVGNAGDTLGWGYAITNDDPLNWLEITNLDSGSFQFGTPDSSIFDYPIVPPSTTLTIPFAPGAPGLFQFTWNSVIPPGAINVGVFTLGASWFDGDPLAGGVFLSFAPDLTAPYSVTATAVPEPSSLVLLCIGSIGVGWRRAGAAARRAMTSSTSIVRAASA